MATVQEAFDFAKDPSARKLGITINGKTVGGGEHIPKRETQDVPRLTLPSANGTYLAICLDLDAPFATIPFAAPVLHWIQPGFLASSGDSELDSSGNPCVADWAPAGPPPGAGPHRYVFLLYTQPDDFDGKKFGQPASEAQKFPMLKRVRFDFPRFVKEANLSEPVAANWFVSN